MVRAKSLFLVFILSSQILEVTRAKKNSQKLKQEDEYDSILDDWTWYISDGGAGVAWSSWNDAFDNSDNWWDWDIYDRGSIVEWSEGDNSDFWEVGWSDWWANWDIDTSSSYPGNQPWDIDSGTWNNDFGNLELVDAWWDIDEIFDSGSGVAVEWDEEDTSDFWEVDLSEWWANWDVDTPSQSASLYWPEWDTWEWSSFPSYDWEGSFEWSNMVSSSSWSWVGEPAYVMDPINVDQYWSEDPHLNWCKDDWYPDIVSDSVWADLVDDFVNSGNLTNWCAFPGQIMVVSDLRNVNLNDPNALPMIFDYVTPTCTERLCQRHLENRKKLDPNKLVERVWRVLEIYRSIGCMECFCKSGEKDELAELMSITKDHLRNNEFLSYKTTEDSPEEVVKYFEELKKILGLDTIKLPHDMVFITLKSMEEAVEGPGRAALDIQRYSKLAQGIYNFCG